MNKIKNLIFFLLTWIISFSSFGALENVDKILNSRMNETTKRRALVISLVDSGYIYTAIPWMKEYLTLTSKTLDPGIEKSFDKILEVAGVKQFEVLPLKFLMKTKSPSIRYILAKKYFKNKNYNAALKEIKSINPNHPVYPYALNLEASIYSFLGKYEQASKIFKDCENMSKGRMSKVISALEKRQLKLNEEICTAGIARSLYAARKFTDSSLVYLDIPKSSHIWPSILFEEAWNSYYEKNYNRSLGKLVTYKAPVFKYFFNPEVDVLRALSYLKLCLYDDAQKESDDFYSAYMTPTRDLRNLLRRQGKNYAYYYRLYLNYEKTKATSSPLLTSLLNSISKEGAFLEIKNSLLGAASELQKINTSRSRYRNALKNQVGEVIQTQKNILGGYLRKELISKYAELYHAFEGMSYIKLEVLSQKKERLYAPAQNSSKRGDLRYLDRNEKQYFWNFNGEFWADELGDYVFALKSEC